MYFEHPTKVSLVIAHAPMRKQYGWRKCWWTRCYRKRSWFFEDVLIEAGEDVNVVEDVVNKFGDDVNVVEDDVNVVGDGVDEGGEDVNEVEVCEDLNYIAKGADEGGGGGDMN